jgi:molybdopterin/thiamine biosynthesis adenylyltransferase
MKFTDGEVERYARQLVLREIGGQGQQRLKVARVLIVGAGGLGCPAALYLAAAGVGTLALADPDTVAVSNLHRQILFGARDLGRAKALAAGHTLSLLNPHVEIEPLIERVDGRNAEVLVREFDLVLDGTDDFASRFAVNAACHATGRRLVSGAIGRWSGQVAVFESGLTRGRPRGERKPCYRCLVADIPPDAETCAAVGVMGALAGVVGSLMAAEAIKAITGAGETLSGRLMLYDALSATSRVVGLSADPECPVCGDQTLPPA